MRKATAETATAPLLTASTVTSLIARLGGRLAAIDAKADATVENKEKARKLIVPLMAVLNSIVAQVDEGELDIWIQDLAPRFLEATEHVKDTLGAAAGAVGGCFYRRGDSALLCITTTEEDCEGLGQFDPNGCPTSPPPP